MKALTISSKGQIAIPKEIRDSLNIKEGDRLVYKVDRGQDCIRACSKRTPSQSYFWSPEVQKKVKKADKNFKAGNFKTYAIDKFVKGLKD
ncbi:MAG: AbrB/MazE/SpoVT family DNA-binding domain-containing protein [Planctomycetes bacterium]|nr:AbrB/MazE/SpoVT family DNA-binding domain-containing protein [Planctomycetota bacterium]